jgi:hypothetical protein
VKVKILGCTTSRYGTYSDSKLLADSKNVHAYIFWSISIGRSKFEKKTNKQKKTVEKDLQIHKKKIEISEQLAI